VPHYFFRRNEVPGSFIRKKSSASLVFQKKNEVPHYFFRKKCFIILSEKCEAPDYFFTKNQVPH
jgi:hypothetical protein